MKENKVQKELLVCACRQTSVVFFLILFHDYIMHSVFMWYEFVSGSTLPLLFFILLLYSTKEGVRRNPFVDTA